MKGQSEQRLTLPRPRGVVGFSKAIFERICTQIADGETLRTICNAEGMPSVTTVMRWLIKDEVCREQYREAKQIQADLHFEEILDIADGATPETVHVAKLRIWTRQWIMGRINAKKYGDKQGPEITVRNTLNNITVLTEDRLRELQEWRREALENGN